MCLCPDAVRTPMLEYLKHIGMTKVGKQFLAESGSIGTGPILQPEDLAKACIDVLDKGEPGSVWYVHRPDSDTPAWEVKDQVREHQFEEI